MIQLKTTKTICLEPKMSIESNGQNGKNGIAMRGNGRFSWNALPVVG